MGGAFVTRLDPATRRPLDELPISVPVTNVAFDGAAFQIVAASDQGIVTRRMAPDGSYGPPAVVTATRLWGTAAACAVGVPCAVIGYRDVGAQTDLDVHRPGLRADRRKNGSRA